jgi:hypothetical protein
MAPVHQDQEVAEAEEAEEHHHPLQEAEAEAGEAGEHHHPLQEVEVEAEAAALLLCLDVLVEEAGEERQCSLVWPEEEGDLEQTGAREAEVGHCSQRMGEQEEEEVVAR